MGGAKRRMQPRRSLKIETVRTVLVEHLHAWTQALWLKWIIYTKQTSLDALLHNPILLSMINYKDVDNQEFPAQPLNKQLFCALFVFLAHVQSVCLQCVRSMWLQILGCIWAFKKKGGLCGSSWTWVKDEFYTQAWTAWIKHTGIIRRADGSHTVSQVVAKQDGELSFWGCCVFSF